VEANINENRFTRDRSWCVANVDDPVGARRR
jgi:hypothetical protein